VSNTPFSADTNLEGDYSSRETSKPPEIANVWTWNPQIKVDSNTHITLELRFNGGFEGNSNRQESVLLPVDSEFRLNLNESVKSSKGAVLTPGLDQRNPPGGSARISPTGIWPNGKAYFFKGSQYLRYDPKTDKADEGYPLPIAGHWPGFPPEFGAGVDAEILWNSNKVYFFKGSYYLRYDIAADRVDAGYPLPIAGNWPGIWNGGIDAGVVWPNGKAYFFKGSKYIRYDIATDQADPGFAKDIQGNWPGFPASFAAGIDNAVVWNNGKAYFFKGSEYIRYDIATDKTDVGDPLPVTSHWRGFWE
jgi:hypothetical protein